MLCSLTNLSIGGFPRVACSIFHYFEYYGTLRELGFDGGNFLGLSHGEELTDDRTQEMYNDIRILNQVPKFLRG